MITIRDFANKMGCSVQNVYQLIKKNTDTLDGHVNKRGSKTFLDDFAQDYLSSFITPKAIVQSDTELINEINRLRAALSESDHRASLLSQQNAELAVKLQKIDTEKLLLEKDINVLKDKNEELAETGNELLADNKIKDQVIAAKEIELESERNRVKELEDRLEKANKAGFFKKIFTSKW